MSDTDFSSDDSIADKDCEVPKEKRIKKCYRKPNITNDILFTQCFEIIKKVSAKKLPIYTGLTTPKQLQWCFS